MAIAREKELHAQGKNNNTKAAIAGLNQRRDSGESVVAPREETPRVKAIRGIEDRIRKQNFESAAVVDSDGNQLFFKDGQRSQIGFSRLECAQMRDNTLTHNHPRCSMFSPEDLNCMAANGLYEIRATNRDGTTYSMRQASGGYSTDKAIQFVGAYASEYPKSTKFAQKDLDSRGFQDKIWKGEISHDEANMEFGRATAKYMADWTTQNAPKYGLEFSVEHASVSAQKSMMMVTKAQTEKDDYLVLDRDTNGLEDKAFNEWLKKHGLKTMETAKSFSQLLKNDEQKGV